MLHSSSIIQLSQAEEHVFYLPKSIEKLISLCKHRDFRSILLHLSWENLKASVEAVEKFCVALFDYKYDQSRYANLLKLGYYLLSLDDSICEKRLELLFTMPIYKMSYANDPNTFFDAVFKTRITINMFYVSLIIWWSDLMYFGSVLKVTKMFAEKLKPFVMEGVECRYTAATIYWDYMEHMRSLQEEIKKAIIRFSELFKPEELEPEIPDAEGESEAEEEEEEEDSDSTESEG